MTLTEFLDRLAAGPRPAAPDGNLAWLQRHIERGYRAVAANHVAAGLGPWPGDVLLIELASDHDRIHVPVALDDAACRYLRANAAAMEVRSDSLAGVAASDGEPLTDGLRALLSQTEELAPDERAVALMDWAMETLDASRCALIPFESGAAGPPIAHHMRGEPPGSLGARDVPRKVVQHVALTRQPRIKHIVGDGEPVSADETAIRQQVRSYMAVPVVFRGELLAVCYVDRFEKPKKFTDAEEAMFEALAYELATPLLRLRDERRRREYRELRDTLLEDRPGGPQIVSGESLSPVLERARRLAPFPAENLVILGETGVGKEVIARYIHEHSDRPEREFVAVNVSALSPELFESELMGSVRGAFTGAVDRAGRVSEADGGTLFLDEIGDLALANQVKLLRFLQDKQVTPVGGRTRKLVDVRVIAATNRPIGELVARGDFREDLFHRFAPPLEVPPLRRRTDEILPHARAWLKPKARQAGVPVPELSDEACAFLTDYPWPGNVRQLEAVISHALLLATRRRIGQKLLASLVPPKPVVEDAPPTTWKEYRAQRDARERAWLEEMLAKNNQQLARTARAIDTPLSTLRSVLKRHGIRE